MTIRLLNVVEPVVPLFRDLGAALADRSPVEIIVSRDAYRSERERIEHCVPERVLVHRVGGQPRVRSSAGRRAEVTLRYLLGVLWCVLSGDRGDVNVVLSQPPGLQPLVVLIARLSRQRTILHVMDLYPDALVASGRVSEANPLIRFWSLLTRWSLRRADGVVVIGACMAERVTEVGVPRQRVHVIRNWGHRLPSVSDDEATRDRADYVKDDELLIGYSGNIGVAHDLGPLLDAAEQLASEDVHVLIRGDGIRRRFVEREVARRQLRNVAIEGFVPESMLARSLATPHVHVVTLRPEFLGLVVPSKAYGAFAAGRPVLFLGPRECDVARDIEREAAGAVVGSADELVTAIRKLWDPSTLAEAQAGARRIAAQRSGEEAVAAYVDLIDGLRQSTARVR